MNPDTARLARAATLQVRPLGNGGYRVSGGATQHVVTFTYNAAYAAWCDCEDFRTGRGTRACKHILAVALTLATDEDRAEVAALLGIG